VDIFYVVRILVETCDVMVDISYICGEDSR